MRYVIGGVIIVAFLLITIVTDKKAKTKVWKSFRNKAVRERMTQAILISKVDESYEDSVPVGLVVGDIFEVRGSRQATKEAHWLGNPNLSKRLIFDIGGKRLTFEVDDEIYDLFSEKDTGALTYKGDEFVDFKVQKKITANFCQEMGEVSLENWTMKIAKTNAISHWKKMIIGGAVALVVWGLFIGIIAAYNLRESNAINMGTQYEASLKKEWVRGDLVTIDKGWNNHLYKVMVRQQVTVGNYLAGTLYDIEVWANEGLNDVRDDKVIFYKYTNRDGYTMNLVPLKPWIWIAMYVGWGIVFGIFMSVEAYFIIRLIKASRVIVD